MMKLTIFQFMHRKIRLSDDFEILFRHIYFNTFRFLQFFVIVKTNCCNFMLKLNNKKSVTYLITLF